MTTRGTARQDQIGDIIASQRAVSVIAILPIALKPSPIAGKSMSPERRSGMFDVSRAWSGQQRTRRFVKHKTGLPHIDLAIFGGTGTAGALGLKPSSVGLAPPVPSG